jgi:hypothetical protein
MARKERRYHYIYKITCLKNDRYYIGMHSTDNLDDGYFGGGKRIKNSVKKHGKSAHKKEILEFFETRELLRNRETELVNENLLKDPMCMNLQPGGGGGFSSEEHRESFLKAGIEVAKEAGIEGAKRHSEKMKADPEYRRYCIKQIKESLFGKGVNNNFSGRKHTVETKKKIGEKNSISQNGKGNSQFGTRWINNNTESKKIKKTDELPDGWTYGRKIK